MELQPQNEFHNGESEQIEEPQIEQEELIPVNDDIFVKVVGLKGDLPEGFGEKILDLRTRYLRENPAVIRREKYKNQIKQVKIEHEWFRGIYNVKNNTAINVIESIRVKDLSRFKEILGPHYPYIVPEETVIFQAKTPTQGMQTAEGSTIHPNYFAQQIHMQLENAGVDPAEIADRISIKVIPSVNSERLKEKQASGEVVLPPDMTVTTLSVVDHKYKKPFSPRQFRKSKN